MAYDWNIFDVFGLLGIQTNASKEEVMVRCPFCGGKRFAMNQRIGAGHCFNCNQTADSASYYTQYMNYFNGNNMSLQEGRKAIKNALGISSNYNTDALPKRTVFKAAEQKQMAPISDVDFTYRAFLNELTLTSQNRDALRARGFTDDDIELLGYKSFPSREHVDFRALCKRLLVAGCRLEGVPGFFQDKFGNWTFVALTPGIIVPQKTINNQIFGFQIRKDDDKRTFNEETGELEEKCVWFSSKNCRNGCKATAGINFSCDFMYDEKTGKYWMYNKTFGRTVTAVMLTEGAMKADLVHCLEPSIPVISVAGVHSTTYLEQILKLLKKLGVTKIIHAYDMDYQTNKSVEKALTKTRQIIIDAGLEYKMHTWDTRVQVAGKTYDLLKGIDDRLAFDKKGIVPEIKEPQAS